MSSSSPRRIRDQIEAARALGVSDRTLQRWERQAWWPRNGRTKAGYDVAAIAHAKPKSELGGEDSPLRTAAREAEYVKTIEDGRRAKIRRETDELKLRTSQGELIPRLGVEQSFSDLLTGIADWCEQLPDVFIAMLPIPKKHHKACRSLLKELLEQRQRDLADELEGKALARDKDHKTNHG